MANNSIIKSFKLFLKEVKHLNTLLNDANKSTRRITFYSEKDIYFQYYDGLIDSILTNSDLNVAYITSDPSDPAFHINTRIRPFYIKHTLNYAISRLDSKILIMTMPDLNNFFIKRSPNQVEHIYVFHAIVSTHMQYRSGAFNGYDTIFCVGPHHVKEIRKTEEIYHLAPKKLIHCGYQRLEKIYRDHQKFSKRTSNDSQKIILIAPTWGDSNILESCIGEIISILSNTKFRVFIRPHPEFVKRRPSLLENIRKRLLNVRNIELELDLVSDLNVHKADLLITDRSGIAYEYAFGTERPVLFINTPLKINNPEYSKLDIEPIEVSLRSKIGKALLLSEVDRLEDTIHHLISSRQDYSRDIARLRSEYIFNWMESAQIGCDYVLKRVS